MKSKAGEAKAIGKEYVPLWKQWRDSKEFEEYKKNELPSVHKVMREFGGQLKMQKERNELMANEFNVRWIDSNTGKMQETMHKSEKAAKDKARDLSFQSPNVQVGEVDDKDGSLKAQWSYAKGKQTAMDTKKQVSIAPIAKAEASALKTNMEMTKGNKDMATKSKKAAKVNGKAKATAKAAAPVKAPGKGGIREAFGLREGTNKAKIVDALLEAKGKALSVGAILKAAYGSAKEDNMGALTMALKGVQATIAKNKIKYELIRNKDEKGVTFALKTK